MRRMGSQCVLREEFLDYFQFKPCGYYAPKFHLLKFHTIEATFWIDGKIQNVKV